MIPKSTIRSHVTALLHKLEGEKPKLALPKATDVIEITPAMATDWLTRNTHNRQVSFVRVVDLIRHIENGEWLLNGQAISFDVNGRLLDGQHRLFACAVSGHTLSSLVCIGLDPKAFKTIDLGAKRTVRDFLSLEGLTSTAALAGALRINMLYESDDIDARSKGLTATRGSALTPSQALEAIEKDSYWAKCAQMQHHDRRLGNLLASPSMEIFLRYKLHRIDQRRSAEFLTQLELGQNLPVSSPIFVLRQRLIEHLGLAKRYTTGERLAWAVKAWNAYIKGESPERLTFSPKREDFPRFIAPAKAKETA